VILIFKHLLFIISGLVVDRNYEDNKTLFLGTLIITQTHSSGPLVHSEWPLSSKTTPLPQSNVFVFEQSQPSIRTIVGTSPWLLGKSS